MVGANRFHDAGIELDLMVGGTYRFTMQPPEGEPFHLGGRFLEIERPARLVYTFAWEEPAPDDRETLVTLTLADAGDATDLSLTQGSFATEERLELHRNGWTESFGKLRRLTAAAG
ncbi:activator of Hsp90 ATPase 1 family protein [Arthrobacter crystallopoietes BAB-32]|uniref:Activator of Hsp90 ATPase 1 family protein n=1 Tax=Arthrobacter crystallopoietes BAB-32 TaxID=1246476 RepID=N1V2B6_9MICC|nr:activator of Hsp90 ATPase 1 family protein [Arthrobacter crystallopoietes BAB-32]